MKNYPLVSVVIPYYKKKFFFEKTIKSILNQSYKNFEIILIYDDNNLEELDFLKNIKKKFKNVKLIINKKNLGPGLSRNKGILLSKGTYIAFCDADDIWKKNKLNLFISDDYFPVIVNKSLRIKFSTNINF